MSDLIIRHNLICLVLFISRQASIATKKGNLHAENGNAGRLHGNHQRNNKFQLTSAELQVYNFYRSKNRHDAEATSKERSKVIRSKR